MKLVAFGILLAILGVGCALEAGDPTVGDPTGGSGGVVTAPDHGFQLVPAAATATTNGSHPPSTPGLPEPSPWKTPGPNGPVTDNMDPNEQRSAPEPAPWRDGPSLVNETTDTSPSSGGNGGSGKSTSSAAPHGTTIGHWDLKDVTSN
jgi:hypothetical protein